MRHPFPSRVPARLLGMLSVGLAVACGDPVAPGDFAGTYTLQRVDGDPLPTVLFTTEYVRVRVLADTLRLNANGTGLQISVREVEPLVPGLPAEPSSRVDSELRFETKGGRIEVSAICPPNANCAPPPYLVARAVAEGLRVDVATGQRVPLLYTRATGAE